MTLILVSLYIELGKVDSLTGSIHTTNVIFGRTLIFFIKDISKTFIRSH